MDQPLAVGFRHFALAEPQATAVIDSNGVVCTRGQLLGRSNRLARALRAAGLEAGDTVGLLAPNCTEFLEAFFAATQIGLYFVSINSHLARPEIAYILEDSGAKALLAHSQLRLVAQGALAAMKTPPRLLISFGEIPGFTPLEELCAGHSDALIELPIVGRQLIYTSATTGRPKGVEAPLRDAHKALERSIQAHIANGIRPGEGNVHLCASMLYHPAPLDFSSQSLHMGHTVVLVDNWEAERLLQLIDEYAVTTTFMVPAMFVRMLKLPAETRSRYATASLRFVAHSAAPCPLEIKRQMIDWWGPILWEAYGSSEGGGTIVGSKDWLKYPGTVGRPFEGSKLKILDEDGHEVPRGTAGTVYLTRYTGDRFQYRGDPAKTAAAHRGDFFTAGDVGYLNEDGYLFLCDRKIDMIDCGGMKIYPAEIEQVLVQHPRVVDCAVFGIPDKLMGEAIKAVIQPRVPEEAGPALTAEIYDFLSSRLSPSKLPRRVEYMDALPRDPNGKIYKRQLREQHWADLGHKI